MPIEVTILPGRSCSQVATDDRPRHGVWHDRVQPPSLLTILPVSEVVSADALAEISEKSLLDFYQDGQCEMHSANVASYWAKSGHISYR